MLNCLPDFLNSLSHSLSFSLHLLPSPSLSLSHYANQLSTGTEFLSYVDYTTPEGLQGVFSTNVFGHYLMVQSERERERERMKEVADGGLCPR